jgi:hypothetical protein
VWGEVVSIAVAIAVATYLLADLNLPWFIVFAPASICVALAVLTMALFLRVISKPFPFN